MATFVVGKPTPVDLGKLGGEAAIRYAKKYAPKKPRQKRITNVEKGKYYFVISKGFANKFEGGNVGSKNGKLHGCFASHAAAEAFVKENNLRLVATIVAA